VEQPIACQFWRRVIVLPESVDSQADEQTLQWCLAHEWSHLERGDWRTWMLAGFTRAVFFYQPLLWWLRWQLRLCQDFIADAEAAGQSPSSEDYAAFLTSRASSRPSELAIAGLGIRGRKSDLFRRVVMLVENRKPLERRCPKVWSLAALIVGGSVLCTVGTYGENPKDGTVADGATDKSATDSPVASAGKTGGETKPTVSDFAGDQADTFRVAFPGGVTLELVGVAHNNPLSNAQPGWWKPDGSTLGVAPYGELGFGTNHEGRYEFAVQVGGTDDFVLTANGPDETRVSDPLLPNSLKDGKDTGIRGFVISRIPKDQQQIDVRLAIATGPWQAVESWEFRRLDPVTGQWRDRLPLDQPAVFVNKSGVVLTPPREQNDGTPGSLPRTFVNHPSVVVDLTDTFADRATRLVAVDRNQNVHQGQSEIVGRGKDLKQRRIRFEGLTLEKLVELRFEGSDYTWARFENVSLKPGHKTGVKVSQASMERMMGGYGDSDMMYGMSGGSMGMDGNGSPFGGAVGMGSDAGRAAEEHGDTRSRRKIDKASLRYDGRTFDQWRRELLTELKTERCVEALNALAAFAPHGFARDAAEVVLEATANLDLSSYNWNDNGFKSSAVSVFAKLDAKEALPVLLRALQTGTTNNRTFACRVLLVLWSEHQSNELIESQDQFLKALADSSRHRDHRVRLVSMQTATQIAPSSKALHSRVREAFKDENLDVVLAALRHPSLVIPETAPVWFVPECLKLTRHEDSTIRQFATDTLGHNVRNMPKNAVEAMPRLIELLGEGQDVRLHACHVIADIGPPAKSAVPALIEIVKNSQEAAERLGAATALENIGHDAKDAVSVLEPLVQGHQRHMDAISPIPSYRKRDGLWYRAGRALKAIQDPRWFQEMRKARTRGGIVAHDEEMGAAGLGFGGMEYDSGHGGYPGGYGGEEGYGSMYAPGAGGFEDEGGGSGASEYESGPSARDR